MGYSGAGGKLIDEKTRSEKSRDTVPLNLTEYFLNIKRTNSIIKIPELKFDQLLSNCYWFDIYMLEGTFCSGLLVYNHIIFPSDHVKWIKFKIPDSGVRRHCDH
jgi:hypothetical protein